MPIRRGNSRAGLETIVPAGHEILGFNDLGDPLALAPDGRVIEFAHDLGSKSVAFRTREQFEAFVAFQHELKVQEGADLATLRAKKERLAEFAKTMTGCPFAKQEIAAIKSELADAISDLRFAESPQGKSLAKRKAFGVQCEATLHAAGCDRDILSAASFRRALAAAGRRRKDHRHGPPMAALQERSHRQSPREDHDQAGP